MRATSPECQASVAAPCAFIVAVVTEVTVGACGIWMTSASASTPARSLWSAAPPSSQSARRMAPANAAPNPLPGSHTNAARTVTRITVRAVVLDALVKGLERRWNVVRAILGGLRLHSRAMLRQNRPNGGGRNLA